MEHKQVQPFKPEGFRESQKVQKTLPGRKVFLFTHRMIN
jgi:hypothetical protein